MVRRGRFNSGARNEERRKSGNRPAALFFVRAMFTGAEKIKIRTFMGWPAFATSETILEGAMDLVGNDIDGATYVREILARLATIETEIASLHSIALAQKVEESELNPRRYQDLKNAGRREVQALAICFRVTPVRDIFGAGSMSFQVPWG